MTQPSVAAVVLNYNGKDLTLETVKSLLAMTYPACEVVVVDNASTDGSYEAVAEAFPDVAQVRVEVNQGPVSGMNAGLRYALEQGFDYALLLNNDIEVDSEMVTELV
ncbi:MAG: glycosyltransferase, partial [Actinomycetia bacterium]|nr:glycosyltransferase [Actinomycetes bacterium]